MIEKILFSQAILNLKASLNEFNVNFIRDKNLILKLFNLIIQIK